MPALHEQLGRRASEDPTSLRSGTSAFNELLGAIARLHAGVTADGRAAPAWRCGLFDPTRAAPPTPPSDEALFRVLDPLSAIAGRPIPYGDLDVEMLGTAHEALLACEEPETEKRRRMGAHYTSRPLTEIVVARALAPLLRRCADPESILDLRICDPSMGSGAFLMEACRQLAIALVSRRRATSMLTAETTEEDALREARRCVAEHCLFGVDKHPLSVDLARLSLWLLTFRDGHSLGAFDAHLRVGDALLGEEIPQSLEDTARERRLSEHQPLRWREAFPEVLADRGGFDAFVGNPPWVSYAGRAAQPLDPDLRAYFLATSEAFAGYRNLQAIFVERAAAMLRPGGRLGFVLPTSMSDLAGYEPSRRAHDAWCAPDEGLPNFGDAFDDVFQPSMALFSTRRDARIALEKTGEWSLARSDLTALEDAALRRLDAWPKLPPYLFGERGFQTMAGDVAKLRDADAPEGRHDTPLRIGADIEAFRRRPPSLRCDPADFGARFRPPEQWQSVKVLIRQTARYPMAALSDGAAFRNSVLAGFSDETRSAAFLVAYLNSSPVRWFHYVRHRDARQGMPQMKIGHLRALPDFPAHPDLFRSLEALGAALGQRNSGMSEEEQDRIDAIVSAAWALDPALLEHIRAWSRSVRG